MKNYSTVFLIVILILIAPFFLMARTSITITPYNVISIFYNNIKKLQFRSLLTYLAGEEKLKFQKIINNFNSNKKTYWSLKKQADSLKGYIVYKREIFKKVALISYAWKVEEIIPSLKNRNIKLKKNLINPFQALLYKMNNKWYIVATHASIPESEKKIKKKQITKKRKKKTHKR